jgi:hypothetical protein
MAVNSHHPEYAAYLRAWLRARDVVSGDDAVKAAGERYLPRLEGQSVDDYEAYRARAAFFNATARTADGFVGLLFRRAPALKLPDAGPAAKALAEFVADVDLLGTPLATYAKQVVVEVLTVGRAGTLIDWEPGEGGTPARAYAVRYAAEDILNWRTERINGRQTLSLVVLKEQTTDHGPQTTGGDEFEPRVIEQLRVLRLLKLHVKGEGAKPVWMYQVELWREQEDKTQPTKTKWTLVETRVPLRLGQPLPQIPFVFHGPRHSLPAVDKLPLADIIAVNLDHYRLDADFKHGLHFTALPTAWVCGFDKAAELRIGASTAWVSENAEARAGFLEFTGQGLTTFERAMDRDERLMAILGTRMLEAQKRVGESADAIELRQSGETSVLTTLALSVSDSLSHVLRWAGWWHGTEAQPEDLGADRVLVQLNEDFSTRGLSSEELTALVSAWQAGAISRETMFELFRRGEVLPPGRTDEEEKRLTARTTDHGPQDHGPRDQKTKAAATDLHR